MCLFILSILPLRGFSYFSDGVAGWRVILFAKRITDFGFFNKGISVLIPRNYSII